METQIFMWDAAKTILRWKFLALMHILGRKKDLKSVT